jgi:acyl carrier protein
METEFNKLKQKIKRELADFLGIGMEDIEDETFFVEDLHMNTLDMTDFMDILDKSGLEVLDLDISEVETFLDLVELINDKHI